MEPQQKEVSQQFERSKAAFAKKDNNSCSELKVLPNAAQEQELVTKKTLSQEMARYMRLFHDFKTLRLEQIDMEDSEDKEKQKKEVESNQRNMVSSAIWAMTLSKRGGSTIVQLLDDLKEKIKDAEKVLSLLKDQIAEKKLK